jgi:putative membrane protein
MLIKRNFNPIKVVQYVKAEVLFSLLLSVLVCLSNAGLALPFSTVAILGSALAIFIAFRNNASYGRWWEARTVWGSIVNNSRIFARQVIANVDTALALGKISEATAQAYKQELIYRQIAFAHALRLHLRAQHGTDAFAHLLPPSEMKKLAKANNIPNMILLTQGMRIKEGMRLELLGAFDNISLEPTVAGFSNFQGACERIKNTPMLRQYDFFTRLFMYAFMLLLPFALLGEFSRMNILFLMPPVSVLISFVFAIIGKVGEVNEDPFENRITDIPMTAMCNTIERDLKEMLGEDTLPPKVAPQNGYLD